MVGLASVALTACTAGDVPAAPADDPELVLGRTVYANQCASCHGPDGGGGRGTQLNGGMLERAHPDPAAQRDIVANGRGTMPGFSGRLSAEEIDAVVRYTREIINDVSD